MFQYIKCHKSVAQMICYQETNHRCHKAAGENVELSILTNIVVLTLSRKLILVLGLMQTNNPKNITKLFSTNWPLLTVFPSCCAAFSSSMRTMCRTLEVRLILHIETTSNGEIEIKPAHRDGHLECHLCHWLFKNLIQMHTHTFHHLKPHLTTTSMNITKQIEKEGWLSSLGGVMTSHKLTCSQMSSYTFKSMYTHTHSHTLTHTHAQHTELIQHSIKEEWL